MMSKDRILVFIVVSLLSDAISGQQRRLLRTKRIVGGTQASPTRYPYFAAIYGSNYICGGTLVHEDVVLTNAHCDGASFRILVNETTTIGSTGFEHERVGVHKLIHPDYIGALADDLMLIKLNASIDIPPIQLNNATSTPAIGAAVTLMGFGATTSNATQSPTVEFKNEVDINTLDFDECNEMYRSQITNETQLTNEKFFCTLGEGTDACDGDSGGPVIVKGGDTSTDLQVGIISFGRRSVCADKPGVHVNISHYYDFLLGGICVLSDNPPDNCPSCPIPHLNIACVDYFDPVTCGECGYETSCLAMMAGFSPEIDCVSKEETEPDAPFIPPPCPIPDENAICSDEIDAVICGPCEYDNSCLAGASGFFPDSDCGPKGSHDHPVLPFLTCPNVLVASACTLEIAPIICGQCEYDNPCLADIAGFSLELDCRVGGTSEAPTAAPTCPTPAANISCIEVYDPVVCGGCDYSNSCFASAAGFAPAADCVSSGQSTEPNSTCATPPTDTNCSEALNLTVCGGCAYINPCQARASGFDTDLDCTTNSNITEQTMCPEVDPTAACPTVSSPITCGDCTYDNTCQAESAGLNINEDCSATGSFCFSGSSIVQVKHLGSVFMRDVQVGDEVKVDRNKYERIYTFGHRDTAIETTFVQLLPSKLELSPDHMVLVQGEGFIPASMVKVGDKLSDGQIVEAVRQVVRKGVFNPFTSSGTIVVNGVKASNYVALQSWTNSLMLGPLKTGLTFHWLDHTSLFPHRFWCHYLGFGDHLLENGFSSFLHGPYEAGVWYLRQNAIIMGVLLIPFVVILLLFVVLESLLMRPLLMFTLMSSILWLLLLLLLRQKIGGPKAASV